MCELGIVRYHDKHVQRSFSSLLFLMSSTELHQVVFKWPHTEPTTVIVTGTFDEWKSSICLAKNNTGFEGAIQIPWGQTIKFKFIVDGEWLVHQDQLTEVDPGGFVNNIYTAPTKPINIPTPETTPLPVEAEKPTTVEINNHRTNDDGVVAEVAEKSEDIPQSLPKEHAKSLTSITDGNTAGFEQKTSDTQTSVLPQLLSDLASTIAARDGTSSALAYVASGLGAAMHNAVGIDPINIPKIAIPTPKYDEDFTLPPGMGITSPTIVEEGAPGLPPSPMAPLVPIMIVPVNAAENNTVASSPTPESMHILPRFAAEPSMPDTNDVPDVEAVTEKVAADRDMVVNAVPVPEAMIKESAIAKTEVASVSDVALAVESEASEQKANGPSRDSAPVNTFHIPEPIVEESTTADAEVTAVNDVIPSELEAPTEKMIESSSPPVNDIFPPPEPVIKEIVPAEAKAIPVKWGTPTEDFPEPNTRQHLDEASSIAIHGSQGQHEELEVSTSIPITTDATPALVTGSADTVLVPSNEAIISPVPLQTSVEEVKPEDLFSDSAQRSSDKKSAVIETVVEPIPATIPVDVAEPETKLIFEAKSEDSKALEPTETDPVLEEPPAKPIAAENFVERTPIPVIEVSVDALKDDPVNFETATTSATATVEPVSTSPVTPTVTEVLASSDQTSSLPAVVVEESTTDSKPVVAEVIPSTESNLVTEEKPGELAEPSAIVPGHHAVNTTVVTEEVAEPIPTLQTTEGSVPSINGHFTPTIPITPRKETPTIKGIQEFPSLQTDSPSQTADNSPSSSKFNSVRKKRTSILGKIKSIFHHDKEKEKK